MKDIRQISNRVSIAERVRIIGDRTFSVAEIADNFLQRANQERIADRKVIKLLDFMLSFEAFSELESYFFYLYDPNDLSIWNEILDHVYARSITEAYLMN